MATDVLVVGGGAAGIAAAVVAARSGCTVTLIDSSPAVGGQYYRGAEAPESGSGLTYEALRRAFDELAEEYLYERYRYRRNHNGIE